ncbi:Putative serine/threonine-protein kinase [Picochlorum sp. SENEW3]|nr:Putative serine/threonine-protein kinase [Picochlorum sp. SENEW3]
MSKTKESQTVGQNLGRTELPSFFLLDVVLIPDDEEYISKYKEYIYGDGSSEKDTSEDNSAGPSGSSRPGQFGFGQQSPLKQEATPSRPTADHASGSNRGGPNQDKSAGSSSSSRPGQFGFGQQFALRQEATPSRPTAENATNSSEGRPKQDNSAGPSSSSRPGQFGFGQQSPLKQEATPPQPTGGSTSLSSRAARRKMRVCRNRWEKASNGGDSMHPQLGRTSQNGVPWRKTTVREEYDHGAIWYVQLDSISARKEYASKCVEELRWEHSQNTVTKDLAVIESYSCLEKPTPFLMAVLQGRLALCKVFSHSQWLWERRWPMYRTDVKACSQIMMGVFVACIHGRVDMFECLLKALLEGGIVSSATALSRIMQSRDENGRTPCILASMHGHNDVLQSFIALLKTPTVSAGSLFPWTAHVNAQDRLGKTALMYACESGNLQIAKTLIKQGVNLDMQDKHDLSALEYAMSRDHKEIILALINAGADLFINGKQILIGAAEKGDLEMLQTLIKLNFDLNRKCIAGRTAVMFAVHEDQEEAVQTLLKAGADAAVRDENDDTILTLAAEHASARMVNVCLEYIPAEMIDFCTLHERWTALMLASKRGDENIVKALLKAGASVLHKRDIHMMSTIDLVSNGDLENKTAILELLREREAAERLVEQMSIQQISECDQGDSIAYDDLNIETDRSIGRGSFSVVKMATWRGMDVAVKELTSNLSLDTQDILRSEVQTLSSLRHPSIVSYYGYCEDPPCIVMELCADSLSNLLHQCAQGGDSNSDIGQTMTWKCRLQIATDTAEGMTYLHKAKNYYHRDLRTANILITSRYQAKISDMGLTKKALKVSRNSAGTIAASTPRWLAPEILSNGPFTSKSDVYSFGTVLYELATWKQPWAGIEEYGIPHLILVKKERLTIPDLESIPGPQPTEGETFIKFREIADRCLAVDPSDRPEFEEIVSELKQILKREQTPEDQQMSSCIVCLSKSSECAYINCGHCCVCEDCAQIDPCSAQCPICRKAGRPTKIFFS